MEEELGTGLVGKNVRSVGDPPIDGRRSNFIKLIITQSAITRLHQDQQPMTFSSLRAPTSPNQVGGHKGLQPVVEISDSPFDSPVSYVHHEENLSKTKCDFWNRGLISQHYLSFGVE